jgi:molybdopterin-containing oxidoreductase family iron-sulfur binding subunit
VRHALPYLVPPEEITPGVPVRYASTCLACPASCGLLVTVLDGRPVKLEGNPEHPLSGGGLCARGQADVRALYDAGRLQKPTIAGQPVEWRTLDEELSARLSRVRPDKLFVLAPTLVSPSARVAVEKLLAAHPGVLVEHDPGPRSTSALLEAYELLDGRAAMPSYDLTKTDILVSFDADLLGTGPEPVALSHAWGARRRDSARRGALRHVQIEATMSLTGASADERLVASTTERRALLLWLLARVTDDADVKAAIGTATTSDPRRAEALLGELLAAKGRSLVACGSEDPGDQVACALLNRSLGNEGKTLDPASPSLVRRGLDRDLAAFTEALFRGDVDGAVILELDPVDQLPNGLDIAKALGTIPLAVAIMSRPTATAAACRYLAAAHHHLERWGDAQVRAGLATLAQPTIRPIFDTRDPLETLLRLSGASEADPRSFVRSVWNGKLPDARPGSDSFSDALAAGTPIAAEAAVPAAPTKRAGSLAAISAAAKIPKSANVEAELHAQVGLGDGRAAHNPWLRELPDPLTRVSWTPVVRIAPARARQMRIADGDLVSVETGGRTVTLPARLSPGQHPDVVALPVGYGRKDGDASNSSRNAYRLAAFSGGRLVSVGLAARLTKAGSREDLPLMQPHGTTEGRPIVKQVGSYDAKAGEHETFPSLWPERKPTSPKWEMVVDLDACTGCSACVVACQAENNLSVVGPSEMWRNRDMYWLRIDRYFAGDDRNPDVLFEPMLCAQCDNAPCETVCPVAATVHSEDGLNQQVYNRCVGTRYCANNCQYKVRRFNWFDHSISQPIERLVLNPSVVARARGVMEKCTFCVQRIQAARIAARRGGQEDWRGRGGMTACQETCPSRAITFGDATAPHGAVAQGKESPRAFQVLAELGIKPGITYLAKVRTLAGKLAAEGEGA